MDESLNTRAKDVRPRDVDPEKTWSPDAWSEADLLAALRAHGAHRLRSVCFRENRRTIWSVTQGGTVFNLHVGFRGAGPELLEHLALIAHEPRGSTDAHVRAKQAVRDHPPLRASLRRIRTGARNGVGRRRVTRASGPNGVPVPGPNCATPAQQDYLTTLYRRLNARAFDASLPADLPLRLSRRMKSTWGWVMLGERGGRRWVGELALNLDLMLQANDQLRIDVMLHEMAHIEAWIEHGDRGHGAEWKRVARRVGCNPRARGHAEFHRRTDRRAPVLRVPPMADT